MFQYTPYALLLIATCLLSLWLAYAIWIRRPGTGIVSLVTLAIGLAIWSIGDAMQLVVIPINLKIVSFHLSYLGISIAPAAWFVFMLEYIGKEKWVTKRLVTILSIEPILLQLFLLTNPLHNQLLSNVDVMQTEGLWVLDYSWETLF